MIFVGLPALLFVLDAIYVSLLVVAALVALTVLGRAWTSRPPDTRRKSKSPMRP